MSEEKNDSIEVSQILNPAESSMVLYEDFDVEQQVALFKKRADLFTKFKMIALTATNQLDWCDQEGTPYLEISGVFKAKAVLGLNIRYLELPKKTWSEDEMGKFYMYTTHVEVSHPFLGSTQAIGSASQRDPFFSKKPIYKNGKKVGTELKPAFEINEVNIKKKSGTNAISRGVHDLLALKNITWEELAQYKIQKTGKKVEYGKKGNGQKEEKPKITKEKVLELTEAAEKIAEQTGQKTEDILIEATAYKFKDKETEEIRNVPGESDLLKLTPARATHALKWMAGKLKDIEAEYES